MTALDIARERQLDWLLAETLGEPVRTTTPGRRSATHTLLTAALITLATGVALAIAWLRVPDDRSLAQEPEPTWYHCYSPAELHNVPAATTGLRCYDFDDDALAKLKRFTKLQRLDLSGMLADQTGTSVALPITDAGVAELGELTSLRWLSLSGCYSVKGATLDRLRAIPQLDHLDLGATSLVSESFAHFAKLPSLRSLVLSYNLDFDGRSLADIARLPGLRRLELAGCATVSAADVSKLAQLRELRHLDLTGCAGAFRGQTGIILDDLTNGAPPPPPKQDGIGVTDAAIAALRSLPLVTLKIGSCGSLTDAVGASIAEIKSLRHLDLSDLQRTTTKLLRALPDGLRSLSLDGNQDYDAAGLRELQRFGQLTELGLNGLNAIDDDGLAQLLANKRLEVLRVGGSPRVLDATGPRAADRPQLTAAATATIATQHDLRELDVSFASWLDASAFTKLGKLPKLRKLTCRSAYIEPASLGGLATSTTLHELSLLRCHTVQSIENVRALVGLPLTYLDLYGTRLDAVELRDLAPSFPDCTIRLPNGFALRVPK